MFKEDYGVLKANIAELNESKSKYDNQSCFRIFYNFCHGVYQVVLLNHIKDLDKLCLCYMQHFNATVAAL